MLISGSSVAPYVSFREKHARKWIKTTKRTSFSFPLSAPSFADKKDRREPSPLCLCTFTVRPTKTHAIPRRRADVHIRSANYRSPSPKCTSNATGRRRKGNHRLSPETDGSQSHGEMPTIDDIIDLVDEQEDIEDSPYAFPGWRNGNSQAGHPRREGQTG